jgi:hypothetical protein
LIHRATARLIAPIDRRRRHHHRRRRQVTDGRGASLRFGEGRKDFIVPEFIAWGDPAAAG